MVSLPYRCRPHPTRLRAPLCLLLEVRYVLSYLLLYNAYLPSHSAVRALYNCNVIVTTILYILYALQIINLVVLSFTILPRVGIDLTCFPSVHDYVVDEYYMFTMYVFRHHPSDRESHPPAVS